MSTQNSHVTWLIDQVRALTEEREACERRVTEIDRVVSAAQIMIDELTRSGGMLASPITVTSKTRSVARRSHRPARSNSRDEKPTQEDWLVQYAKDHGGYVKVTEAKLKFIEDGMTEAKLRNVYGNIFGIMKRSEAFELIGEGTYRWLPFEFEQVRKVDRSIRLFDTQTLDNT